MMGQEMRERFWCMAHAAQAQGLVPVMFTISLPSRFHPMRGGLPNECYGGETPSERNQLLLKAWAGVRAALARRAVRIRGIRMVEPNCDATPHWHVLMFARAEHLPLVEYLMRDYMRVKGEACLFGAQRLGWAWDGIEYVRAHLAKGAEIEGWGLVWGIRLQTMFGLAGEDGAGK